MIDLLLSVPFLFFVPGYLIIRVSRGKVLPSARLGGRAWLQGMAASIVIGSWIGLILLECGVFSVVLLTSVLAALSALVYLVFRPPLRGARPGGSQPSAQWPLVAVIAVFAASCLFFGSSEYIFGGWDSGEYVNMGALIARRGGIVYRDDFFASIPEPYRIIFTQGGRRYMGFNLLSLKDAIVSPKFMHLYPIWLAVGMSLSGLRAALSINILFSVLSVALCYRIALRLRGWGTGIAAAVFMAANLPQLWFLRSQCAEPLAQFFFLGCIYFWVLWQQGGGAVYAPLSAAAAGMMFLTKIDALIILPAIGVALALSPKREGRRLFAAVLAASLVHSCIHLIWWDRPYARAVFDNLPLAAAARLPSAAAIAVACVAALFFVRRAAWIGLQPLALTPRVRLLGGALLLAGAIIILFVRPAASGSAEAGNLPQFCRILGEGLFWWAFAGFLVVWMRGLRFDESLLWLSALFATTFFSFSLAGEGHLYPWSARRFLPITVPACAVFAGCFTSDLRGLMPFGRRWIPAAGLSVLLIQAISRYPFLVTARDYPGAVAFIRALGDATRRYDIVVCEQVALAVPLDFIWGRNVLLLKDDEQTAGKCAKVEELLSRWLSEGKRVAYVTSGPVVHGATIEFREAEDMEIPSVIVPLTRHAMPPGPVEVILSAKVLEARPVSETRPPDDLVVDMDYNCFGLEEGFHGPNRIGRRGGVGRWTGPRASLIIPWPAGDTGAEITLSLSTGPRERAPVELLINGLPAGAFEARGGMADYTVEIPPKIAPAVRRARLELRTEGWDPAQYGIRGYPSPLGVFLDKIRIRAIRQSHHEDTKDTK